MVNKKRDNRTAKEIAIEIRANEEQFRKFMEETKNVLVSAGKEFESIRKQRLRQAGQILEQNNLEPVYMICRRLKREFNGIIAPATVQAYCKQINPEWLRPTKSGHQRKPYHKGKFDENIISEQEQDLTPEEKEYVQEVKEEFQRDKWVDTFIELWTGKSVAEQGRIMRETARGGNWRRKLVEESRQHILTKVKRMTDAHVEMTFNYMRTLGILAEAVGDVLYEEVEARKRKAQLGSI